jgi:hypothetical protein
MTNDKLEPRINDKSSLYRMGNIGEMNDKRMNDRDDYDRLFVLGKSLIGY